MAKKTAKKPVWLDAPEDHDYPAARDYLSLLLDTDTINAVIERLDSAETTYFKAKDILRASTLDLLKASNKHVAKDLEKIVDGKSLSPVLLVRGDLKRDIPLTIADGYHRICASYWTNENTDIPCRIVDL